jgi:hypothetical protein
MDYPAHVIELVLDNWDMIESMKLKMFHDPEEKTYTEDDPSFYRQEGNTLTSKSRPKNPSGNSNARIESLCVLTTDIENAINNCLTESETFSLKAQFFMKDWDMPMAYQIMNQESIAKLVNFLN